MYFSWLVFIALFTFAASTLDRLFHESALPALFFCIPKRFVSGASQGRRHVQPAPAPVWILFLYTYQGAYLLVPLFPVSAASCSDLHDLQLRSFILLSADFHISAYHYRISLL